MIKVQEINKDVATQLLHKCLINPNLVSNLPDTEVLLKKLTYLPPAIIQAVAYINKNDITFAEYLSLLVEQEKEVVKRLSEEFKDDGRYYNMNNPVAMTWLISFSQIRNRKPLAADYLLFMACLDPKNIPQFLLPVDSSQKKEIGAIRTLEA